MQEDTSFGTPGIVYLFIVCENTQPVFFFKFKPGETLTSQYDMPGVYLRLFLLLQLCSDGK